MEEEMKSGLPPDHCVAHFTSLSTLQDLARAVLSRLEANNDSGNQFIVVKNIPKAILFILDNDSSALGVEFRLQFAGRSAVIKIVPSYAHDITTRNMSDAITLSLERQGTRKAGNYHWAGSSTFKDTTGQRGKQADDCFLPRSRMGMGGQSPKWPTFVVESAVTESHAKLLRDASWWFENSNGEVRMVLLLTINRTRRTVEWELLQLAQPGQSAPADTLDVNPPARQQYVAQQGMIDAALGVVTGTLPMTIFFHELFDRPPNATQGDISFTARDLLDIAECI